MRKTLQERFDRKWVENPETGCWDWTAATDGYGYGQIGLGRKVLKASRVSYELFNGPIPDGEGHHGTCVCHRCDNRKCVNPEHLFLGTHDDNVQDMVEKGRCPKGDGHWNSKFTPGEVELIRAALDRLPYGGLSFLARWFGVHKATICCIRKGKSWA